jgi:hypothetical protein
MLALMGGLGSWWLAESEAFFQVPHVDLSARRVFKAAQRRLLRRFQIVKTPVNVLLLHVLDGDQGVAPIG